MVFIYIIYMDICSGGSAQEGSCSWFLFQTFLIVCFYLRLKLNPTF